MLFAVASVARLADHSPEMALRAALSRFARRFRRMEAWLHERGRDIHTAGPEELERLWNEAKAAEGS